MDLYLKNELQIDEFITHHFELDKINDAFDVLHKGESIRSIVHFDIGKQE